VASQLGSGVYNFKTRVAFANKNPLDVCRQKKKQWSVFPLMRWPPRSPDLAMCDLFLWGFIKDCVFVPPLPATLVDLRTRITAVVTVIDHDTLQRVWQELDYRLDVYRVMSGAYIEHLQCA
jgi:hypothetical protein